jgi:hypothetical protein
MTPLEQSDTTKKFNRNFFLFFLFAILGGGSLLSALFGDFAFFAFLLYMSFALSFMSIWHGFRILYFLFFKQSKPLFKKLTTSLIIVIYSLIPVFTIIGFLQIILNSD